MPSIALPQLGRLFGRTRLADRVYDVLATLRLAMQVRRERRALLTLDDATLKDVGFSRGDAHAEAQRSFWDVPVDRLRI